MGQPLSYAITQKFLTDVSKVGHPFIGCSGFVSRWEQLFCKQAGDPATVIDPDTGETLKAYVFVGVMTYSQYAQEMFISLAFLRTRLTVFLETPQLSAMLCWLRYAYVEAFLDMKQKSWISAHVHMYEYFGGVARILVPDNVFRYPYINFLFDVFIRHGV